MERKSLSFSFIRVFLSIVLIISLMPAVPQSAFADDTDTVNAASVEAAAQSASSEDGTAATSDEVDAEANADACEQGETATVPEANAEEQSSEASSIQIQSDRSESMPLGFIYFGESDITAGAIQKIAVAIDGDSLTLSSATLVYVDPQGTKHEVASEKCADAAALFSVPAEGPGIYRLLEMKAEARSASGESKNVVVDLAKEGENSSFEVAADTGMTLSVQSEDDGTSENGMTVYALDSKGEMQEADDIATAAVAAGISVQANDASSGKFVVALDPGHGGSDSGAVGSTGLKESDVTWKIMLACKAELEKYPNVEVYVTRAQNDSAKDLAARVQRAVDNDARVFVSLHINSAGTVTTAKGAEVWYPNSSSYNNEAHVTGKELSQNILKELVALGLSDRGVKIRNSENGSKYPDGSTRDYYGVIASARERGIPGIIVEHAFISNPDDEKKLANDAFLKQLGRADAEGIAKTFGLKDGSWVSKSGGWVKQSDGIWKYQNADGSFATNQWVTSSGKQYWVNAQGAMVTGLQTVDGKTYLFESSGAKSSKTGWQQMAGTWCYLKAGVAQTGWIKSGGSWYYLDPSTGKMATGWVTVDGKKYYLNASGAMRTGGWFKDGGTWYWLTGSGAAQTGWLKAGGKWYWFDKDTAKMATGWATIDGKKYYLNASGAMRTGGWFKDGGTWYWLTGSGAAQTGWLKAGGKWYWFDKDTAKMATGWTDVDGKKYYLNASGAMRGSGWFKDGNSWHWITGSGAAATAWQKIGGKWYYLDPSSTTMHTGWTKVDDTWYFLDEKNGDMKTGWLKQGGTWYYLNGSGAMLTGWHTIAGKKYYLDQDGKMYTGYHMLDGQPCFFESSGVFVGNGTPIMGASQTTAAKMAQAYIASGNVYPATELAKGDAPNIQTFCKIIEEEAKAEGVRAEVVWAQIMLETGWLRFGNDVKIEQFNFAGLGATGGGEPGNVFPDVRTGIRAQVQHLKCYASTEPLNQAKVDQRWYDGLRGKAKLVEWLGIPDNPNHTGWAAGADYGAKLIGLMRDKLGCQ